MGMHELLAPLWLSVQLAAVTTLVLIVVGTPVAWWLAQSESRYQPIVQAAVALPIVLPPTVMGFYLQSAISGMVLPREFWSSFVEIPNVVAIKIAPFHRYQTLDVLGADFFIQRPGRCLVPLQPAVRRAAAGPRL